MRSKDDEETCDAYFRELRQGDLLDISRGQFDLKGDEAVVVSQTCDVVLPKRPTVLLAAVCELGDLEASIARRRDNPRYVEIADQKFADLCHVMSVDKSELLATDHRRGVNEDDDADVRVFALAIGRWFSRFAVPDAVVPWLRPLQASVRSKYDRPNSALGQLLHRIAEIRIEANNWSERPVSLRLHVIAKAGEVPVFDDPPELNDELRRQFLRPSGEPKSPQQLAELIQGGLSPAGQYFAWMYFVESLAADCRPSSVDESEPDVANAVKELVGELWSDDEFPLSRVRKSELLDLDYLSTPTPL
jgi:hypothetical protein